MAIQSKAIIFLLITFLLMVFTINTYAIDAKQELKNLEYNWGIKKIKTDKSWSISQGNKIIVAIIDTGTDINHPALKNNIWINPNEIPNNNIDDDKNGYIDDINGWNFVNNTNQPTDNNGHGTHISGIVRGVAPDVQLMVLKYFDPKSLSDKNLSNTVKAIEYAIKNGAQIINYSGGGFGKNAQEEAAIQKAKAKNILFVAAAGNEKSNSDKDPFYPASYDLSNIISVASLNEDSELVESSNFGETTVDIAAPGKSIYSTLPNGRYGQMTGTSQATAFVTGALALLLSSNSSITTSEKFIEHLAATGDIEKNLFGKTKYKTKLNSYRALAMKGSDENANGFNTENTKLIDSEIFSSNFDLSKSGLNSADINPTLRAPSQSTD